MCKVDVLEEVSEPTELGCALMWNFAKRLMVENFSNSWASTLMSTIDRLFSSLHHRIHIFNTYTNVKICIESRGDVM